MRHEDLHISSHSCMYLKPILGFREESHDTDTYTHSDTQTPREIDTDAHFFHGQQRWESQPVLRGLQACFR
eukprot:2077678-Amphidinium_carterae.1